MEELEANFVGREIDVDGICGGVSCCLEEPGNSQRGNKIVGLYGQAGVGKTRLARHCVEIIRNKMKTDSKTISINLRGIESQGIFLENVALALGFIVNWTGYNHEDYSSKFYTEMSTCTPFGIGHDLDRWQANLSIHLQCNSGCHLLVLFDNAEDMALDDGLQNAFLRTCSALALSNNVTVFITSRIRYAFAHLHGVYKVVSVQPMKEKDSIRLLKQETSVDLGEHASRIVTLCAGIPLALILTASELNSRDGMLTPGEMVELLEESRLNPLSPESCAQDEHMNHIVGGSISRLREKLRDTFALINFIPGTFGAEAATAVIGARSSAQAKKSALIPLNRHSMVAYDGNSSRFDIHPFVREWIETNLNIKELPAVRGRYIHFFGTLLQKLQESFYSPDSKKSQDTLASISTEKSNLQKLLHEAIHCSDDTFPVYMKLATFAKPIIENYMTVDAIKFFKDLYEVSEVFGDDMDRGVALSNVGMVIAEYEGNREGGKVKYDQARAILECHGDSLPLLLLYRSLAWNEMYRGNSDESIRLANCACEMQARLGIKDDLQAATTFNILGIILMNSGKPEAALEYLKRTLHLLHMLLPEEHIALATPYNGLGQCYGKIGNTKKKKVPTATLR